MKRRTMDDATINLTPMIDVVFLLVIFFMVGSRFDQAAQGVDVQVPGTADLRSMSRMPDQRVVEVSSDGSVTLDGSAVSTEQLTRTLRENRQTYPGLRVAVRGDANGSLQRTVEVMQLVRGEGIREISLSTRSSRR